MSLNFRFAIVSDLHIALPETVWDHPSRFHLVEVSIPAFESILERLAHLDLDFLLLPGDLTQHGEPENHRWLAQRLAQLPYPVYVIPGNHDIPALHATPTHIGAAEFPRFYEKFGYSDPTQLYYTHQILPGVRLIGLNSNGFDANGHQIGMGVIDDAQWVWLQQVLAENTDALCLVMLHHNLIEHLPGQSRHGMGRRYMVDHAPQLATLLYEAGVRLVFTGHLHVQDIAFGHGLVEVTTGSLVSYPHPYRVLNWHHDHYGRQWLQIESDWVDAVPGWDNLLHTSREWMGDRSLPFMLKFLTQPPNSIPTEVAQHYAADLRYFWATIAQGDTVMEFPQFPEPISKYLRQFGAVDQNGHVQLIDNNATLLIST